jgi:hypothetical protein
MRSILLASKGILAALMALCAGCTPALAQATNYAATVECDLSAVGTGSLPALVWLENSNPLLELQPTRNGAKIAADTNTRCRVTAGPWLAVAAAYTATNYWPVTNAATFWVQFPAIQTNAVGWVYAVFFDRISDGWTYWSGSGGLTVLESTFLE